MIVSPAKISAFRRVIFSWWKLNKRDLPWRHTHDPYKILVSECMLQQTQVGRVIQKYQHFIQQFPTIHILAQASLAEVIICWKGLGYNRRAKFLLQTAKILENNYKGIFPDDEKSLLALPGVGIYTARAILVFAFQKDVAMVDTNIRKIITTYFFAGKVVSEQHIMFIAQRLVPKGKSWEWHQALMDFGSGELPTVLKQKGIHIPVPKQSKFIGSRRYYRGKILEMLRKNTCSEKSIIHKMIHVYKGDRQIILSCLENLKNEGLIKQNAKKMYTL